MSEHRESFQKENLKRRAVFTAQLVCTFSESMQIPGACEKVKGVVGDISKRLDGMEEMGMGMEDIVDAVGMLARHGMRMWKEYKEFKNGASAA